MLRATEPEPMIRQGPRLAPESQPGPGSWPRVSTESRRPRQECECFPPSAERGAAAAGAAQESGHHAAFITRHQTAIPAPASSLITQPAFSSRFITGINNEFRAWKAIKMCD